MKLGKSRKAMYIICICTSITSSFGLSINIFVYVYINNCLRIKLIYKYEYASYFLKNLSIYYCTKNLKFVCLSELRVYCPFQIFNTIKILKTIQIAPDFLLLLILSIYSKDCRVKTLYSDYWIIHARKCRSSHILLQIIKFSLIICLLL